MYACSGQIASVFTKFLPFFFANGKAAAPAVRPQGLGHPTGRIINQRPGYELDPETVLKEAADYGCLMEMNAQPTRLDLDDTALLMARRYGVRVVINSDAHAVEELDFLEFGVYQARRGWLEADDVANTRPLAQFRRLVKC